MPGVMQKCIYFCVHSQPLSIGTVELVDDSGSQSENKPAWRSPSEPRDKNQTGSDVLWQSVLTVATDIALRLFRGLRRALRNTIFNSAVGN